MRGRSWSVRSHSRTAFLATINPANCWSRNATLNGYLQSRGGLTAGMGTWPITVKFLRVRRPQRFYCYFPCPVGHLQQP